MRDCSISYEKGPGALLLEKGDYYLTLRSIIVLFRSIIAPFSFSLGPGTGLSRVAIPAKNKT